jgi:hypothetical protein
MIDGLGFGLVEKSGTTYYQCIYRGYEFEYEAPEKDLADKVVTLPADDVGGTKEITVKSFKDADQSALDIKDYFDKNIAGTQALKDWYTEVLGKTAGDVEYYADEEAIKTQYDKIDWTEINEIGKPKPVNELLEKTIKTNIDGTLVVIK